MNTLQTRSNPFAGIAAACSTLVDEATTLVAALLQPNKVIDEVKQARALQVEAQRIAVTEPARAAALYRQASRIGRQHALSRDPAVARRARS